MTEQTTPAVERPPLTEPAKQLLSLVENLYEDVRSIERREVGEVYKLVAAIATAERRAVVERIRDELDGLRLTDCSEVSYADFERILDQEAR
jgi:hypothetical protein